MITLLSILNAADRAAVTEQNFEAIDRLLPPVGSVIAWLKTLAGTPALPAGWVECAGQVLDDPESVFDGVTIPDLNGALDGVHKLVRGNTASGAATAATVGAGTNVYDVVWVLRVK